MSDAAAAAEAAGAPASASSVPEEAEVAELKEMIKRPAHSPPRKKAPSKGPTRPQAPWNDTPHRRVPPALRGLKTDREPWAKDANFYEGGMEGHGAVSRLRRMQNRRPPTQDEMQREYEQGVELWKKEQGWNPTPFRNAPWQIRGLNPVTREPWFEDMAVYNAKFAGGDDGETEYQDGSFGNHAITVQRDDEKHWDSSTMRYVPYALRGLKPVTNEPWARDEAVYRAQDGMDEVPDDVADMNPLNFGTAADRMRAAKQLTAKPGGWDTSMKAPEGAMKAYPS